MNSELEKAMDLPPDFSSSFTDRMAILADHIARSLSIPVSHETEMNYSSAQKLKVWADVQGTPVLPLDRKARYVVVVFVSSRAPYCAIVCLEIIGLQSGRLELKALPLENVPPGLRACADQIAAKLADAGYHFISGDISKEIAKGHVTEMDGAPATVFDVLFSEIIG